MLGGMATAESCLNLRERKALRTQRAIVRATAELTLEEGYAAATIPRIAERADVAPRTVSRWFPVKDEILFGNIAQIIERAREHLGRDEGDTVQRLRTWFAAESEFSGAGEEDRELEQLKLRVIENDPELHAWGLQHFDAIRQMMLESVARDLGTPPSALAAHSLSGAVMGLLAGIRHARLEIADPDREQWNRQVSQELDRIFAFVEAGIEMLRAPAA